MATLLVTDLPVATCIACGCTDDRACPDGCSWLRIDYRNRRGVCTNCPEALPEWDGQGDGDPAPLDFEDVAR